MSPKGKDENRASEYKSFTQISLYDVMQKKSVVGSRTSVSPSYRSTKRDFGKVLWLISRCCKRDSDFPSRSNLRTPVRGSRPLALVPNASLFPKLPRYIPDRSPSPSPSPIGQKNTETPLVNIPPCFPQDSPESSRTVTVSLTEKLSATDTGNLLIEARTSFPSRHFIRIIIISKSISNQH